MGLTGSWPIVPKPGRYSWRASWNLVLSHYSCPSDTQEGASGAKKASPTGPQPSRGGRDEDLGVHSITEGVGSFPPQDPYTCSSAGTLSTSKSQASSVHCASRGPSPVKLPEATPPLCTSISGLRSLQSSLYRDHG